MMTCSNCGQQNAMGTFVCRYCGAALSRTPQASGYVPPKPFWGAEHASTAAAAQVQPFAPAHPRQQAGFSCPYCHSTYPPQLASRISTDGWIVFGLLLFFCAPFFWIGLLMKEEYRICVNCGSKFG